jgi:hypothetical protein
LSAFTYMSSLPGSIFMASECHRLVFYT